MSMLLVMLGNIIMTMILTMIMIVLKLMMMVGLRLPCPWQSALELGVKYPDESATRRPQHVAAQTHPRIQSPLPRCLAV